MPLPETQEQTDEIQRQYDMANSQLMLFAHDLKRLVERERQKTRELTAANQQLQAYAKDLKIAFDAEKRKSQEVAQAHHDTIRRLIRASHYKDEGTGAHIKRLGHYAKALALYFGLSKIDVELIAAAAPMHDIGKIGVPDAILHKRGPLDEAEWKIVKTHPAIGASLLQGSVSPLLEVARQVALTHHENWDGSGYPSGLQGEEIPLAGRIVMLVDQYDALRSPRPYKPAFSHTKTCDIMLNGDGRTCPEHFDPRMLDAFRSMHHELAAIYDRLSD